MLSIRIDRATRGLLLTTALLLPVALGQPLAAADTPLPDGGFENGPPPASIWTESTDRTPDCPSNIDDWTGIWGLAPYSGSYDYWAGGACKVGDSFLPITGGVGQLVTVPSQVPVLKFSYAAYRVDGDDSPGNDVARVTANGATVWSLDVSQQSSNTFDGASGGFVPGMADFCSVAGSTVVLAVGMIPGSGSNVGNVRFDDFRWADAIFISTFDCDLTNWSVAVE